MFYTYRQYLKELYGQAVYRVSVDGGFSCPNRNADGTGGCSYCDELGSVAVYQRTMEADLANSGTEPVMENLPVQSGRYSETMEQRKERIRKQVEEGIKFLKRRYKAVYFILYFQAFTGTFAPVKILKELYDYGLSLAEFKELVISTRPDCITTSVVELLKTYKSRGLMFGLSWVCRVLMILLWKGSTGGIP